MALDLRASFEKRIVLATLLGKGVHALKALVHFIIKNVLGRIARNIKLFLSDPRGTLRAIYSSVVSSTPEPLRAVLAAAWRVLRPVLSGLISIR